MHEVIHDIDIKLLRVFREVAKHQSFSLAAESLNTSLSNISMNMAQLESRLEMRLCERGVKGFRLTDQGQRVLMASEDLYKAMSQFREAVDSVSDSMHKEFRIGVLSESLVKDSMVLQDILADVEERLPESSFYLEFDTAAVLKNKVALGELQIAFGYFQDLPDSFESHFLFTEKHACYCSKDHELFNVPGGDINVELLQNCKIAGYDDMAEEEKAVVPLFSKYDSCSRTGEGILTLVLTGYYIGLLEENYARAWVEKGIIRAIDREELELLVDIHVIYNSNRSEESVLKILIESIKKFYPDSAGVS